MRRPRDLIGLGLLALAACRQTREPPTPRPVYAGDIATLLQSRCAPCHTRDDDDDDAGTGFAVDNYLHSLRCSAEQPEHSAVVAGDGGIDEAPILSVLQRPDHRGLLDAAQTERLRRWVQDEAPLRDHGVHAPGILNPHSQDWHGRLAAQDDFGPLTQADHPDVCGRCHAGAPVTPDGIEHPAPGATACTRCHSEPRGVLACSTCHGDDHRSYPPRDRCDFPGSQPDAHRAHLESTRLRQEPLHCDTCHAGAQDSLGGEHGNGRVDIHFDPALAGKDASYDASTGQCSVRCHNRGGAHPTPDFRLSGPLGCGDCHGAPPRDHYAGRCDRCHRSVNADGTQLLNPRTHLDGQVGPGDGPDACGSCHGQGTDPMPDTPSHRLHRDTHLTTSIDCAQCHHVPEHVDSDGHLDRDSVDPADISWGERARARDQTPSYADHGCRDVACHGAGLPEPVNHSFVWDAADGELACNTCHGIPPTRQHTSDTTCASLTCHGAAVSNASTGPQITERGRQTHINGELDTTQRASD